MTGLEQVLEENDFFLRRAMRLRLKDKCPFEPKKRYDHDMTSFAYWASSSIFYLAGLNTPHDKLWKRNKKIISKTIKNLEEKLVNNEMKKILNDGIEKKTKIDFYIVTRSEPLVLYLLYKTTPIKELKKEEMDPNTLSKEGIAYLKKISENWKLYPDPTLLLKLAESTLINTEKELGDGVIDKRRYEEIRRIEEELESKVKPT